MNPTTIQNLDHKIVRFTNVAFFDFTSEMGAIYGGVPYFVPAGKSQMFPYPIGDHLATHLARQIIIQQAPIRDEKETDGKGSVRKLWDDEAIRSLKAKMISEVYEEERPAVATEAQRIAAKVAELNRTFPPEATAVATPNVVLATNPATSTPAVTVTVGNSPTDTTTTGATVSGYADKGEVIAALQKKGIKFDARKGKDFLEGLLK